MVKIILHATIITFLYLTYRTINTPDFTFNCFLTIMFIWFLKINEERT